MSPFRSVALSLLLACGCGPRVAYVPTYTASQSATAPSETVVEGGDATTDATATVATPGPAGSVANASGRWALVCCRNRLIGELALAQEGDQVRGVLTASRMGNAVAVQGKVEGASLVLTTTVETAGFDRIDAVLDPVSGTLTGSLSSTEDTSMPGGAISGTRTTPPPAEAWIVAAQ